MVNRGEWQSEQTYNKLDIVAYNGSSYTPVKDNVTSQPPSADWTILAAKGDTGEPGEAATIQVGSVTTGDPGTNATVINSGTSTKAVLDFTIPRGDAGENNPVFDIGDPTVVHPLYSEMTKGSRLGDDGNTIEQSEAYISDFVALDSYVKSTVHVRTKLAYLSRSAALYDAKKKFIKILGDNTSESTRVDEFDISIPDCKSSGGAYLRFGYLGYDDISEHNFEVSVKSSINIDDYIKNQIAKTDALYGKKYVACGDSFTAGAGLTGDDYDYAWNTAKSYPWWIAKRHNMTLVNEAISGSDFTNVSGAVNPFSASRYTKVPADADYITLMFGLNETNLTREQIGSKTDSDNTTLWGAYNVVFEHFLTRMPFAKIGVIIPDSWMIDSYASTVREICEYWGIPYLDLKKDARVPMGIGGRYSEVSLKAVELRNTAFQLSNTDQHPNVKAHEYRSTFIENFLKSL